MQTAIRTFGAIAEWVTLQSFIDDASEPPEVWAHELMQAEFERLSYTGAALYRGAMRQFGVFVPVINAGIGPRLRLQEDRSGLVMPTHYLRGDRMDVTISGSVIISIY